MAKVPARLGYINRVDDGVVSAGTAMSSLPVSNLQDADINKIWRATDDNSHILADLNASHSLGFVAVVNTNATEAVVKVSTTDATGAAGDAWTSASLPIAPGYRMLAYFFGPVTGRYVRVDLSGAPVVVEAGRFAAGPTWTLPFDISVTGHTGLGRDHSRKTLSLSGVPYIDRKPRQRGVRVTAPGFSLEDALEVVEQLNRVAGTSRDWLFAFNPASSNLGRDSLWGMLESSVTYRSVDQDVYMVDFELWQRI